MPIKVGNKTYKKFSSLANSIARKKGLSKDRANAYAAAIHRAKGEEPSTGKRITPIPTSRNNKRKRKS